MKTGVNGESDENQPLTLFLSETDTANYIVETKENSIFYLNITGNIKGVYNGT